MNASQRSSGSSNPAAAAWPPCREQEVAAGVERPGQVQATVAPARGADHVAVGRPEDRAHDRRASGLVGEASRDEADDADGPRAGREERGGVGAARDPDPGVGRRRARRASACWPGAWPGSGRPNADRASATALRMRSRRVALASSRIAARAVASSGVAASRSRAASRASPTRPAALSRGASTNPTVSRSTEAAATPAFAEQRRDARARRRPHPLEPELRDRPVLAQHRRRRPTRSRSSPGPRARAPRPPRPASSPSSSRATVNATPDPDSLRSG